MDKTTKANHDVEKGITGELLKIAQGAGITFSGEVVGKGVNYLILLVVARLIGADFFGLYILGLTIFQFTEFLSRMGLHNGVLRYVSMYMGEGKPGKTKGVIIQSISISFLSGACLGTVLFLNSNFIAINIFHKPALINVIKVFAFGVPFLSAMMVAAFATRGFQKMKYFVYVKNFFHPASNLALIGLLYLLGLKLYGAVSAWVISAVLGLGLAIYFVKTEFPAITRVKLKFNTKKLLLFSLPLALVGVLQFLIMWTDTFMVGYFRPASEVGIYRVAAQTALLITAILGAFNSIFAPIISDLYNKGKLGQLNRIFKTVTRWVFNFSFPCFIVIAISAPDILRIFGPEFEAGWAALIILAFAQLINASTGAVGYVLIMSGNQTVELYNNLAVSVANVFLNFLLIPIYGMAGAAIATGISLIGLNMARLMEVRIRLNLWPYDKKYLKGLAAGIVSGVFASLTVNWIPDYHFLFSVFTTVVLVSVVFIAVTFHLKLDKEDKAVLSAIRDSIFGK